MQINIKILLLIYQIKLKVYNLLKKKLKIIINNLIN